MFDKKAYARAWYLAHSKPNKRHDGRTKDLLAYLRKRYLDNSPNAKRHDGRVKNDPAYYTKAARARYVKTHPDSLSQEARSQFAAERRSAVAECKLYSKCFSWQSPRKQVLRFLVPFKLTLKRTKDDQTEYHRNYMQQARMRAKPTHRTRCLEWAAYFDQLECDEFREELAETMLAWSPWSVFGSLLKDPWFDYNVIAPALGE